MLYLLAAGAGLAAGAPFGLLRGHRAPLRRYPGSDGEVTWFTRPLELGPSGRPKNRDEKLAERLAPKGHDVIYFLRRVGTDDVKVGTTNHLVRRWKDHRRTSGHGLVLEGLARGGHVQETAVLRALNGEWRTDDPGAGEEMRRLPIAHAPLWRARVESAIAKARA